MADEELLEVKRLLAAKTEEFDAVVQEWEALNEQAVATEQLLQRQSELLAVAMARPQVDAAGGGEAAGQDAAVAKVQRQSEAVDACAAMALRQQAELQAAKQRIRAQ
eukprot:COSAG06_NODE_37879_length_430_cov_0.625378_2_plen_106_part_01